MKFYYKLIRSQAEPDILIASLLEFNIIISGKDIEELDIKMKEAIDGYLSAFGDRELKDLIEYQIRELDYNLEERRRSKKINNSHSEI